MVPRFSLALLAVFSAVVGAASSPIEEKVITPPTADSYEYIVVGSGAGGGPLAARLAQAGKRTLLIEAGADHGSNPLQSIPLLHARASEDKAMSWNFFVKHYPDTTRQAADSKMAWEAPDGSMHIGANQPPTNVQNATMKGILYPRTGTLGGCTTHNALVSIYPHDDDWKLIERMTGDVAWSPAKMRRVFERMSNTTKDTSPSSGEDSDKGWLNINAVNAGTSIKHLQKLVVPSGLQRRQGPVTAVTNLLSVVYGFARVASGASGMFSVFPTISALNRMVSSDLNSASPSRDTSEGMFTLPLAIKDGKRVGSRNIIMETYSATTPDGRKLYPLDIALNTFATKVTFDQSAKPKANGVDVAYGANLYQNSPMRVANSRQVAGHFQAEKEVILSGGAFNTPQILKLSGIGAKEELSKFGISQVANVPGVGTNLQDHMEIGVTHELGNIPDLGCYFGKNSSDPCLKSWRTGASGIYSMPTSGLPFAVTKKSTVAKKDGDFGTLPDLFLLGGPTTFRGYYPGYSDDGYRTGNWSWVVLKAHTKNRAGTVTLRSGNPLDAPDINFNFFEAGDQQAAANDIQAMVEGIELGRKMSTAMRSLKEIHPGSKGTSPAAVREFIKNESWSHHASCTCPIGAADDEMAVLDSKLRVRGVEGLRVADASVFPRIPGFFIALPTYMIGERAADFILGKS